MFETKTTIYRPATIKQHLEVQTLLKIRNPWTLPQAPLTKAKGCKGRGSSSPAKIFQARELGALWFRDLSSARWYQKVPAVAATQLFVRRRWLRLTLCKTGGGLVYVLRNSPVSIFNYYFYNFRGILPTFSTNYASTQLLFIKPGTRLTKIRDIFKNHILFAITFGSFSILKFFDKWSGFVTIMLPSGSLRLFFFLSRSDVTDTNIFNLEKDKKFKSDWRVRWKKAGTWSLRGRRPKVRGVAKNPVDHPHGGRTKSIRFQRTPWGRPAKLK